MESIERALLATVLMHDTYTESESKRIVAIELYEEWFSNHIHKIIVKIINHMKARAMPIYFELVRKEALSQGYNIDDILLSIISANTFSYNTFIAYYSDVRLSKKKSLQELI